MSKAWTFMMIITTTALLLHLAGLGTGIEPLLLKLGLLSSDTSITSSELNTYLLYVLGSVVGVAIIAGFFTKSSFDYVIVAPVAATFFVFAEIFVTIINHPFSVDYYWVKYIILIIWGGLGVGFLLSLFDWAFNR